MMMNHKIIIFQLVFKYFTTTAGGDKILTWEPKGLLEESIEPSKNLKIGLKFEGSWTNQCIFNQRNVVILIIVYELNTWSYNQGADFILGDC